jgi:hypothetical protein
MIRQEDLQDIQGFARKRILADQHPEDVHTFTIVQCEKCGVVPFNLTIERHSGAKKTSFRGIISAECSCGRQQVIFSFTGNHRRPEERVVPVCVCGSESFIVCECERFDGADGLPGFFDEGVVVGKCSKCGRNQVFVYTD